MLKYLYNGSLSPTAEDIKDLIEGASKLNLVDLLQSSIDWLQKHSELASEDICSWLSWADMHDAVVQSSFTRWCQVRDAMRKQSWMSPPNAHVQAVHVLTSSCLLASVCSGMY